MVTKTAPVITAMREDQIKSFLDFIEEQRVDNASAARTEAIRLGPYFNALSVQLTRDAEGIQKDSASLAALSSKGSLSRLFNAVACRTKNTILSELVLMPEALLQD